jgi:hypothetical protein
MTQPDAPTPTPGPLKPVDPPSERKVKAAGDLRPGDAVFFARTVAEVSYQVDGVHVTYDDGAVAVYAETDGVPVL